MNMELFERMQDMNGIIDVLWAELKKDFFNKLDGLGYTNEELDDMWQYYQIKLMDRAREER